VTVVAPAGYGKTTILARWAEADPRPFAWVALDPRDDDPVVLLRYVAGAMHRLEPLPPEVFDALSGAGGSGWTKRVARLGNALAAREQPFVLALDDLHWVANTSCMDVLAELVQSIPAGSQITVASREEPALPLGRWRAQGWVREIGTTELRLDEREAELLLQAAGIELGEDEVNVLTQRTEGWAAGLYLAALSTDTNFEVSGALLCFTWPARKVPSCPLWTSEELRFCSTGIVRRCARGPRDPNGRYRPSRSGNAGAAAPMGDRQRAGRLHR